MVELALIQRSSLELALCIEDVNCEGSPTLLRRSKVSLYTDDKSSDDDDDYDVWLMMASAGLTDEGGGCRQY